MKSESNIIFMEEKILDKKGHFMGSFLSEFKKKREKERPDVKGERVEKMEDELLALTKKKLRENFLLSRKKRMVVEPI